MTIKTIRFISLIMLTLTAIGMYSKTPAVTTISNDYKKAKENKKLSEWIEKEGFRFGISKSDAINVYNLENTRYDHYFNKSLLIRETSDMPIRTGIYRVHFNSHETIDTIFKCIAIEEGDIDEWVVEKAFMNKFGLSSNRAYLMHNGRYLALQMLVWRTDIRAPYWSVAIVEITDFTEQAISDIERNKAVKDNTNRMRNKF